MKKIIAALLAVVMIMTVAFAFASCSSKKYTDKEVTIPVTDENGETVTDDQGKVVTEVSTEPGKDGNSSSTVCPKIFFTPLAAIASVSSAIFDDGVLG